MSTVTLPVAAQPSAEKDLRKANITRHASFNSTPVSVQRQVNSAPCSPRPEMRCKPTSSPNIPSAPTVHHPFRLWTNYFSLLVVQLYSTNLWITPGGPVTGLYVHRRLETAPSEFKLMREVTRQNVALMICFRTNCMISKMLRLFCRICPTATLQTPSCGSSNPTLLVPTLHGEHPLLAASSAPHCLAYLPALSQPSVVMLYRHDQAAEGQRSPSMDCGKRKRVDEEEALVSKRHPSGAKECDMVRNNWVFD